MVCNQLETYFEEARDRHQAISDEIEQLLLNGFKDSQTTIDIDYLQENLRILKNSQEEFDEIWNEIERKAEKELLFTREVFDVIQERFGKAVENGKCWFADEDGVKTIDLLEHPSTDPNWKFSPIDLAGFGGFTKAPFSDRDHFPEIDWIDQTSFYDGFDFTKFSDFAEAIKKRDFTKDNRMILNLDIEGVKYWADFEQTALSQADGDSKCVRNNKMAAQFQSKDHLAKFVAEMESRKDMNLGQIFTGLQVRVTPAPWLWELARARSVKGSIYFGKIRKKFITRNSVIFRMLKS